MNLLAFLIVIWAALLVAFIALLIYRSHLTEQETYQLYLGEEGTTSFHSDVEDMVHRVMIIQPICSGIGNLTLLMTLVIAVIWVSQRLS
jgi:hypothetical protein